MRSSALRNGTKLVALWLALAAAGAAQTAPAGGPSSELYRRLRTVGLDATKVFEIRDGAIDREDIHVTLSSGTIAFSESVDGRITAAFFEGDGEILLVPPSQVERSSLALFTGAAIMEEAFTTAYFRFDDDTFQQLQPSLRLAEDAQEFITRWNPAARTLADADALILLQSLTDERASAPGHRTGFLHARLSGVRQGTFDVFLSTQQGEDQVLAGQARYVGSELYYDIWTSFPMKSVREAGQVAGYVFPLRMWRYKINARVLPPRELQADTEISCEALQDGPRTLIFELSRHLQVSSVTRDGQALEFIQNPALEGTSLARRGNDLVAVVLPRGLVKGERFQLRFNYAGAVLSEAGGGLMYVGARGTWYPSRGPAMSDFDLVFRYPAAWTLVATGKRVSQASEGGEHVARWVSDRPIPIAGFNLGRYAMARVQSGNTVIETYAARGVERSFPVAGIKIPPNIPNRSGREMPSTPTAPAPPDPASEARPVAERAARTLEFLSQRLGPFPFGTLELTQMPGKDSQGWPGLVFLSSYSFLDAEDKRTLRLNEFQDILYGELMPAHENAHQWWGDLVMWQGYRDLWLSEALANYSALLMIESESPANFRTMMDYYRNALLQKTPEGRVLLEAGPVTLGPRVTSSQFRTGFETIMYGRGAWLVHMLRYILRDPATHPGGKAAEEPDTRFFVALRAVLDRYAGRELSTADFQKTLEEFLPVSAQYEHKKSLSWFFDSWVNGTAVPHLEIADLNIAPKNGRLVASGRLVQKHAPKTLVTLVPVYASAPGQMTYVGRVFAEGGETPFHLNVPAGTRKLLLDPQQTILRRP